MAGCPTCTLLMSDSLNATVIVSVSVLTISANPDPEPLLEEPEPPDPPRLPAVVLPAPDPPPDEELEDELEEDPPEPPADTVSPAVRLDSEAIVPLTGAYSFVLLSAVSALWTLACAAYTAASAEAMLPGEGVVVVVGEVVSVVVPPLLECEDEDVVGVFVLGTITVTVTLGVRLTVVVDPPLGFDLPGVVLGVVRVVVPG